MPVGDRARGRSPQGRCRPPRRTQPPRLRAHPADLGQPAEGREPERLPPRASRRRRRCIGSPRRTACTTSWSGSRVCSSRQPASAGTPRPTRPVSSRAPRTRSQSACSAARRAGRAAPGRARGTRPDPTGTPGAAMRCSTASVPMSTGRVGHRVGGGVDRRHLGARQQRGEVVAHARDARAGPARNVAAVAVEADLRTLVPHCAAAEPVVVRCRRPSRRTPRSAPARRTCDTRAAGRGPAGSARTPPRAPRSTVWRSASASAALSSPCRVPRRAGRRPRRAATRARCRRACRCTDRDHRVDGRRRA